MSNSAYSTGSIVIETDPVKIELLKEATNWTVTIFFWKEVRNIINRANRDMKKLLTYTFGVKNFHPMVQEFAPNDTPVELIDCLKKCLTKSEEQIFKTEEQIQQQDNCEDERSSELRETQSTAELTRSIRDSIVREVVPLERVEGCDESNDNRNISEARETELNGRLIRGNNETTSVYGEQEKDYDRHHVASTIIDVLKMRPDDGHQVNFKKKIVDSMAVMSMKNREMGQRVLFQHRNSTRSEEDDLERSRKMLDQPKV